MKKIFLLSLLAISLNSFAQLSPACCGGSSSSSCDCDTTIPPFINFWNTFGNTGTDTSVNFLGTTDNMPLKINIHDTTRVIFYQNGSIRAGVPLNADNFNGRNLFIGYGSGLQTGDTCRDNTCMGDSAGASITKGERNTIIGSLAGPHLQGHGTGSVSPGVVDYGYENFFGGHKAGYSALKLYECTYLGTFAGMNDTSGHGNTFVGLSAGQENLSGSANDFFGVNAGLNNTTGIHNTYLGNNAGFSNVSQCCNVAVGRQAFQSNTSDRGTVVGEEGLFNATGSENTAIGWAVGFGITSGTKNVILGSRAAFNGNYSNKFIVDNQDRGTTINEPTRFLLYGSFDADSSKQNLTVNGMFKILNAGSATLASGVDTVFIYGITAKSIVMVTAQASPAGRLYEDKALRSANNYFIIKSTSAESIDYGWTITESY